MFEKGSLKVDDYIELELSPVIESCERLLKLPFPSIIKSQLISRLERLVEAYVNLTSAIDRTEEIKAMLISARDRCKLSVYEESTLFDVKTGQERMLYVYGNQEVSDIEEALGKLYSKLERMRNLGWLFRTQIDLIKDLIRRSEG